MGSFGHVPSHIKLALCGKYEEMAPEKRRKISNICNHFTIKVQFTFNLNTNHGKGSS